MEKDLISKNIKATLETIEEQFEIISSYSQKIPQIELDIIKGNIRKLYDSIILLDKENNPPVAFTVGKKIIEEIHEEMPEIIIAAPAAVPVAEIPEPLPEEPEPFQDEPGEVEEIPKPHAPEMEEISSEENAEPPVIEHLEPEPVTHVVSETEEKEEEDLPDLKSYQREITIPDKPRSMADLFTDSSSQTLADKFKSTDDHRIADRMRESRVQELKANIGINEKFMFINELFKGKLMDYNRAVELLDKCTSLDESMTVLFQMKINNEWNDDNNAYNLLSDMIRKRFSK